jgi:glycosyltransferase involved in cell wall biosynthesis
MKVHIIPNWYDRPDKADGGIRRVVEAQNEYLPRFGIEVVRDIRDADLINTHGTARVEVSNKPIVNTNHGAMWDRYEWADWAHEVNRQVSLAMIQAVAHTAPSEWVANALRRGMMVYPEVIYHGVDPNLWTPADDHQPVVLWNKARADFVSDPGDMQFLAGSMPDVRFQSTIGKAAKNIEILGVMPVEAMREVVSQAGLYLCTARETFGIGTLEALSCGVPVVGWDWGGQREIIIHGETGFLAKPHDYKALAEGVRWAIENREVLSENARQDVIDRWTWPQRIEQYADLYKRTMEWWRAPEVKVSIIVTTHNLDRYLGDCLDSITEQEFDDWECIVVDDCSDPGDEAEEITEGHNYIVKGDKFHYVRTPENLKLPGARNFGFQQARGRYILFLDADDMLAENSLLIQVQALDEDANIHIAAGHLDMVAEDGSGRTRNAWPFSAYSWYGQMSHLNQIHYSAMMRREVMERTGGFRTRHWRAEDAPFWIRATSFGFRIKKVTEAATIIYRNRGDSKSKGEPGDGDWTSWFPWRMGFETHNRAAFQSAQTQEHPRPDLVPWGAQGKPHKMKFWPVPDFADPLVSVVIPVGPGHDRYVIDALDSLVAQTFQNWEAVVVNATGKIWPDGFEHPTVGAPWAKVVDANGVFKPAAARNIGARHARGDAILWLDADDLLLPHALEEMVSLYLGTGGLIYTSWLRSDGDPNKPLTPYEAPEFECGAVLQRMRHSMMCLLPRQAHEEIGGYDEGFAGWEDWDYLIALQAAGLCSYKADQPGFVYRFRAGTIREESFGLRKEILPAIRAKWIDYYEGRKHMPCGSCPDKKRGVSPSRSQATASTAPAQIEDPEAMIKVEYQGPRMGKVSVRGPVTNTRYTFQQGQQKYIMKSDADVLMNRTRKGISDFVTVSEPEPAETVIATAPQFAESQLPVAETVEVSDQEFPEMPAADSQQMTITELRKALKDADENLVKDWLAQEQVGNNRKGAIKILEERLE